MSKVDNIFLSQTGIFNKKSEIAQHNIANSNVPGSSKIEVKVVSDPYLGSTISEINSTLNPMLARDAVKLEAAVQGNEEATQ